MNNDIYTKLLVVGFGMMAVSFLSYGIVGLFLGDPFKTIVSFGSTYLFYRAAKDLYRNK